MKHPSANFYPECGCGDFLRNALLTHKTTKLDNPETVFSKAIAVTNESHNLYFFTILSLSNGADAIGLLESFNRISVRITNLKYVLQVPDDSAVGTETSYGLDTEGSEFESL
jgi:hypothetical protein